MEVAGVDGCHDGWLVVRAEASDPLRLLDVSIAPTFTEVLRRTADCEAVGIDIPIGLSDDGRREPDVAARQVLRPLRHNSVFPAPVRLVLDATTDTTPYEKVCAISLSVHGKKMSKQAYYIMPKVRQAAHAMKPALQERIVEVHPEVSFWKLNSGRSMANRKSSRDGKKERLRLLLQVLEDDLAAVSVPRGAALDDLYDACAAAWTAGRLALGQAERLPPEPARDSHGLRMEIVY